MKYAMIRTAVGLLLIAGYVVLFLTPVAEPLERYAPLSSLYVMLAGVVSIGVSLLLNRHARRRGESEPFPDLCF